jgi:EmrB/QacA subfamily drug resistance transporter
VEPGGRNSRLVLTLSVLAFAGVVYALLQSLVVPALPALERDLDTSATGVTWVFTSFLLATSVATPVAGRFGDMFGKKRVLLVVLAAIAVGSLMAALAGSLALMIVARTIQGLGGATIPLSFGIIRDEFPRERVAGAIALVSGILGVGGGLGIVLAGPILDHLSYHWLFWIPLITALLAAICTAVFIRESPIRAPGDVHWTGVILLSTWLVSFLLGVSEGPDWGWTSAGTLALFALALGLAAAWVLTESRAAHPLVDMRMMRLGGVWTTNTVALLLGFSMYGAFLLIPKYVQTPASTGYGFGASVTQAGLFLIPMPAAVLIFSVLGGKLSGTVGAKVPLVIGSALAALSFVVLTVAHFEHWQIYFASGLMGIGIGFAFASMANLIVEAVRFDQTGVATGMNTIVRTIGGAIGAQIAASIIAGHMSNGEPDEIGYTITFAICAVVATAGLLAALAVPSRGARLDLAPVAEPQAAPD